MAIWLRSLKKHAGIDLSAVSSRSRALTFALYARPRDRLETAPPTLSNALPILSLFLPSFQSPAISFLYPVHPFLRFLPSFPIVLISPFFILSIPFLRFLPSFQSPCHSFVHPFLRFLPSFNRPPSPFFILSIPFLNSFFFPIVFISPFLSCPSHFSDPSFFPIALPSPFFILSIPFLRFLPSFQSPCHLLSLSCPSHFSDSFLLSNRLHISFLYPVHPISQIPSFFPIALPSPFFILSIPFLRFLPSFQSSSYLLSLSCPSHFSDSFFLSNRLHISFLYPVHPISQIPSFFPNRLHISFLYPVHPISQIPSFFPIVFISPFFILSIPFLRFLPSFQSSSYLLSLSCPSHFSDSFLLSNRPAISFLYPVHPISQIPSFLSNRLHISFFPSIPSQIPSFFPIALPSPFFILSIPFLRFLPSFPIVFIFLSLSCPSHFSDSFLLSNRFDISFLYPVHPFLRFLPSFPIALPSPFFILSIPFLRFLPSFQSSCHLLSLSCPSHFSDSFLPFQSSFISLSLSCPSHIFSDFILLFQLACNSPLLLSCPSPFSQILLFLPIASSVSSFLFLFCVPHFLIFSDSFLSLSQSLFIIFSFLCLVHPHPFLRFLPSFLNRPANLLSCILSMPISRDSFSSFRIVFISSPFFIPVHPRISQFLPSFPIGLHYLRFLVSVSSISQIPSFLSNRSSIIFLSLFLSIPISSDSFLLLQCLHYLPFLYPVHPLSIPSFFPIVTILLSLSCPSPQFSDSFLPFQSLNLLFISVHPISQDPFQYPFQAPASPFFSCPSHFSDPSSFLSLPSPFFILSIPYLLSGWQTTAQGNDVVEPVTSRRETFSGDTCPPPFELRSALVSFRRARWAGRRARWSAQAARWIAQRRKLDSKDRWNLRPLGF
ncbi:hypothetical protein C7M84_024836 [Penaeus vannamei]|uniref:Uncharacterized protein n=1 Tax=Penaeus vannamei TaxID=6689 RepID=A0A3R7PCM9_PENVA|nr:hypothetical protein C7M84_024836 [Penaeus vannamei]